MAAWDSDHTLLPHLIISNIPQKVLSHALTAHLASLFSATGHILVYYFNNNTGEF